jgi:phosphocarrier protein HPr
MVERTATVRNGHGIHCRPSATIIMEALPYAGQIEVTSDSGRTNLRSVLELVSMDLEVGSIVQVRVSGPDEEQVCARLAELFETHFDFPPASAEERVRSVKNLLGRTAAATGTDSQPERKGAK